MSTHHTLEPPTTPLDDSRPDDVPDLSAVLAAATKQEPQAAAPEPAADPADAILEAAKASGFTDEELEGLDAPAVERLVAALDRKAIDFYGKQEQLRDEQGRFAAKPTPGQMFELDLDDTYDDHLVEQLQQMNEFYAAQIEALTSSLQQTGAPVSLTGDNLSRWFDAKVSELGDGYDSVFGKGGIDRFAESSNEVRNRVELFRSFNALKTAYPQAKDEDLFERAMRSSFSWVSETQQKKAIADKAKSRAKTTIGRPSGRASANLERDPETGLSIRTVDAIQAAINSKLNR